jgi:hypothetical protein
MRTGSALEVTHERTAGVPADAYGHRARVPISLDRGLRNDGVQSRTADPLSTALAVHPFSREAGCRAAVGLRGPLSSRVVVRAIVSASVAHP